MRLTLSAQEGALNQNMKHREEWNRSF